jgi:putative ABC transport system permease protein
VQLAPTALKRIVNDSGARLAFTISAHWRRLQTLSPDARLMPALLDAEYGSASRSRRGARPMGATDVQRVELRARLNDGTFQSCVVIGLDDETLISGPPKMVAGRLSDLRRSDGATVDTIGVQGKLAKVLQDRRRVPPRIGDELELNGHRAVVVGICKVTQTFQANPVIYTSYSRATAFALQERKLLPFVVAKAKRGQDLHALCERIRRVIGLNAYTSNDFKKRTFMYFLKYTGMPINFLTAVALGFIVAITIAGQTFYSFTLDNLRYFGTLKAMGTTNRILLQALMAGAIGYGLGVGAASA